MTLRKIGLHPIGTVRSERSEPVDDGWDAIPAHIELDPDQRARLRDRTQEFVAARNELMERHLGIVFRLLERYRYSGVPIEDLIQEANYSLFKAVQGFDFTRGVRFKTYAGYWVNQAFLAAIYNQSRTVRVPAYIQKAMKKIHDASNGRSFGLENVEAIAPAFAGLSTHDILELDRILAAVTIAEER